MTNPDEAREDCHARDVGNRIAVAIRAIPVSPAPDTRDKAATQSKFRRGDRVRKVSGSQWAGIVVGEYSTALTPEGYAVESESHAGSVQIYPARALAAIDAVKEG
jgi:hypothetical protein